MQAYKATLTAWHGLLKEAKQTNYPGLLNTAIGEVGELIESMKPVKKDKELSFQEALKAKIKARFQALHPEQIESDSGNDFPLNDHEQQEPLIANDKNVNNVNSVNTLGGSVPPPPPPSLTIKPQELSIPYGQKNNRVDLLKKIENENPTTSSKKVTTQEKEGINQPKTEPVPVNSGRNTVVGGNARSKNLDLMSELKAVQEAHQEKLRTKKETEKVKSPVKNEKTSENDLENMLAKIKMRLRMMKKESSDSENEEAPEKYNQIFGPKTEEIKPAFTNVNALHTKEEKKPKLT